MKTRSTILLLLMLLVFSGCKAYRDYIKAKKNHDIYTLNQAYDKFSKQIDSVLSLKMAPYQSLNTYSFTNNGYFRVDNINEEEAPYIVGKILSKKDMTITREQLPDLLLDLKYLDTKIKFDRPEISIFINKSAEVNVDALKVVKGNLKATDKMRIVYDKAFSAQPSELKWFNDALWEQTTKKYGLKPIDSLYIVSSVLVKKFTYSIYQSTDGKFSVTPTPVVAIDGGVFQESGGERNIYEVYVQLARLRFPIENTLTKPNYLDKITAPENSVLKLIKK